MNKNSSLDLSLQIFKGDESFVAYSPVLDISTQGDTKEDARNKFAELVRIFFEELREAGVSPFEVMKR